MGGRGARGALWCWRGNPSPSRHPKVREPALASSNANDHLWQRAPMEQTKGAGPGGWAGQDLGCLGSPELRRPAAPTPATAFLPRAGCAAGVSAAQSRGREGSAAPASSRAAATSSFSSTPSTSWASFPPPPCALLPARWSRVDVSGSTWYRGWRISVELNSCHCSDSSRAERRGSEQTSEQASGAPQGQRGREREARTGETGPSVSGRWGRGAGPRHGQWGRVPLHAGSA